jgi:hypothetical protein
MRIVLLTIGLTNDWQWEHNGTLFSKNIEQDAHCGGAISEVIKS